MPNQKKSNIAPNLTRTPDDLGLVQGGPTHDDIGLGHPRVNFTSPESRGGNICVCQGVKMVIAQFQFSITVLFEIHKMGE